MRLRSILAAGAFAAALAVPLVAEAAPAQTTGYVNLRSGPGTAYMSYGAIPAGARIEVFGCSNWCRVAWNGMRGWVSASYVARIGPRYAKRYYMQHPYWDDGWAGYDSDWGPWHHHPRNGFTFGFGFNG
ncbi:MAG TPA: SH3 domain-containing protein [Bauldia sp.]|nr:SH3 domain-containing protein [Bauldia sp.]